MSDPLGTEPGTFKRMALDLVVGIKYLRNFWGQRWAGMFGLLSDLIAEGANQAIAARLPGHPQQAVDSLEQSGRDRDLIRFRGETLLNYISRVQSAWADYRQMGSPPQLIRVLNQWGRAGWPATWVDLTLANLDETSLVTVATPFVFRITILFGSIVPAWTPVVYGSGHVYGENGFYYGIGPSTDLPVLLYLVRKWKPSRSKGLVTVFWGVSNSVTFTV